MTSESISFSYRLVAEIQHLNSANFKLRKSYLLFIPQTHAHPNLVEMHFLKTYFIVPVVVVFLNRMKLVEV